MRGRSSRDKVLADAVILAERLRTTDVTFGTLRKEYECGHATLRKALLTQMSPEEYRALARNRLGTPNAGCFRPGHIPWDKGTKGFSFPGSRATQFQPGHLRGQAARNWRPVGTVELKPDRPPRRRRGRVNAGPGPRRLWIKVSECRPGQRGWMHYARYVWQQAHGPIPPGMVIVHENGDILDDALSNLRLMTRAGSLRHLRACRPDIEERRRLAAAAASRKRHAANRLLRAKVGPTVTVWDCPGCGARLTQRCERCPKCGTFSLEVVRGCASQLMQGCVV